MDNAIIGGLLEIIAVLFSGLLAIYLSRRNARRDSGRQLIAEFAAVEVAFNGIASSETLAIDPLLRKAFPQLEEKINIFKRHLFWPWEKSGFRKAWIVYYNASGDDRCQCYHHYMPFQGVDIIDGKEIRYDNTKTYKKMFKNNVDNLLKYAKQK